MVAMAAVCMTMAVPVTASAAEVDARLGGCPGGCFFQHKIEEVLMDSNSHDHDDGHGGTYLCQRKYYHVVDYNYCSDCGIIQINWQDDYIKHIRLIISFLKLSLGNETDVKVYFL